MEKTSAGNELRNTLKLRHYIMNILYRNNRSSVMIPSIRQLAADFKLAKSTVQLMQEQLVGEGYLFSRKGIGTFTNPAAGFVSPHGSPPPLIGIIWGDGRNFFYDHYICRCFGAIASAVTKDGWNCRHITLTSGSPASVIEEIRHLRPDALVWGHPAPEYHESIGELARLLPLVAVPWHSGFESLNRVSPDFFSAGFRLGQQLVEENRRTLLTAVSGRRLGGCLGGLRQALTEAGAFETELSDSPDDFIETLNEHLDGSPPPDIMVINGRHAETVMHILSARNIDPVSQCRVIALQHVIGREKFIGLLLAEPFDLLGESVADILKKLLGPLPPDKPEQRIVPVNIKTFNLPI